MFSLITDLAALGANPVNEISPIERYISGLKCPFLILDVILHVEVRKEERYLSACSGFRVGTVCHVSCVRQATLSPDSVWGLVTCFVH